MNRIRVAAPSFARDRREVSFSWTVEPATPLYRTTSFVLRFPPELDLARVPESLWWTVALLCLHSHWNLLRLARRQLLRAALSHRSPARLVWLLAPVVGRLRAAGMAAFALAVALSIAVEAVGAFCYPRGGSDSRLYPPSRPWGEIGPEVWSWRGAPVLVEARAGCAPPDLLPHLLRALGRPRTAAR